MVGGRRAVGRRVHVGGRVVGGLVGWWVGEKMVGGKEGSG